MSLFDAWVSIHNQVPCTDICPELRKIETEEKRRPDWTMTSRNVWRSLDSRMLYGF